MFLTVNAVPTTEKDIKSWTWSKSIEPGIYSWNVSTFSFEGERVNVKINPMDVVQGSRIEIHIETVLHGLDYLHIIENGEFAPMTTYIDGNERLQKDHLEIEFIYPNLVGWINGSFSNLFELDKPEFRDFLKFSNLSRIENDLYILEETSDSRFYQSLRDIQSGILREWTLEIEGGNHIVYEFLEFSPTNQINRSLDNSWHHFNLFFFLSIYILRKINIQSD